MTEKQGEPDGERTRDPTAFPLAASQGSSGSDHPYLDSDLLLQSPRGGGSEELHNGRGSAGTDKGSVATFALLDWMPIGWVFIRDYTGKYILAHESGRMYTFRLGELVELFEGLEGDR